MKYLFFSLLFLLTLTSAATASAQTTTSATTSATSIHVPAGARVTTNSDFCDHTVSAELNKYEIRRCRVLGVITAEEAHLIRRRKRVAQRTENAYLKGEAAKLHNEETASARAVY